MSVCLFSTRISPLHCMLTTDQRYRAIQGLLLGIAVGDALALPRAGLSRKCATRLWGRQVLTYRLWPRSGLFSDETQLAFMASQAILQSRSSQEAFHKQFRRRLRWYALSLPVGISYATVTAGLKGWMPGKQPRGVARDSSAPATRSMVVGVVLHNTGHRYLAWARDCATATHTLPIVSDGAMALAAAAQAAAISQPGKLNVPALLEVVSKSVADPKFREQLLQLQQFLADRRTPREVARACGWESGIQRGMVPAVTMGLYCFLRYPGNFRHAVKSAILLGGNTTATAAIAGGLSGAHLGPEKLPANLVRQLRDWPQDLHWIDTLSERLASWPHGPEDLLAAPALPSYPMLQLLRNLTRWPLIGMHAILRLPCRSVAVSD
jgi:ADP-ribosyl-[dinitrogen reductase] hydrolase